MAPIVAVIAATSETKALATETEVASKMRALPFVDYDASARLALIIEAEAGGAWANRKCNDDHDEEDNTPTPMIRIVDVIIIVVVIFFIPAIVRGGT